MFKSHANLDKYARNEQDLLNIVRQRIVSIFKKQLVIQKWARLLGHTISMIYIKHMILWKQNESGFWTRKLTFFFSERFEKIVFLVERKFWRLKFFSVYQSFQVSQATSFIGDTLSMWIIPFSPFKRIISGRFRWCYGSGFGRRWIRARTDSVRVGSGWSCIRLVPV